MRSEKFTIGRWYFQARSTIKLNWLATEAHKLQNAGLEVKHAWKIPEWRCISLICHRPQKLRRRLSLIAMAGRIKAADSCSVRERGHQPQQNCLCGGYAAEGWAPPLLFHFARLFCTSSLGFSIKCTRPGLGRIFCSILVIQHSSAITPGST